MASSFRKYLLAPLFLMLVCLMTAGTAAAAAKTYVVLPFTVNGPASYGYLGDSIPGMLSTRLYWQGNFEPVQTSAPAPANAAAADKARAAAAADYVVWGSVTVVGDNCSLDVNVADASGASWPNASETTVAGLIPALKTVADSINGTIFKRPQSLSSPASVSGSGPRAQMNPELVHNQDAPTRPYMNPQFRYAGTRDDESRLRSQTLSFPAVGMEVCDADGDGRNEVFIIEDSRLHAFRFEGDGLTPLAEFGLPLTQQTLALRSVDLDGTRMPKLVLTAIDSETDAPISRILSFDGKTFTEEVKDLRYFLNVAPLPPMYRPTLIGQLGQPPRVFRPGVYELIVRNGELVEAGLVSLPEGADLYNFSWIPAGYSPEDAARLIMLTSDEHLRLYTENGTRMTETLEVYSGAAQGIEINRALPGMGRDDVTLGTMYFIPMRMPVVSFKNDGRYEVIVNKPISTASQLFSRYRSFPESEIHSLYWDGIGLNMLWKTRRIRGSVADYAVVDVNNDGITDLAVCVNTHPGAIGLAARKSMVVLYPLDLSAMDPNATTYDEEGAQY